LLNRLPKYCILTPVGSHKLYALEFYFNGINNLNYKPGLVVLAPDHEVRDTVDKLASEKLKVPHLTLKIIFDGERGSLRRICKAREELRMWFLNSKYGWALWLDSDISLHPDLPAKLLEYALKNKILSIFHGYPGRSFERGRTVWHGSGIILTHRYACQLARFLVTHIKSMNISEDFNFKSLLRGANSVIKSMYGFTTTIDLDLLPVKHYIRPGFRIITYKPSDFKTPKIK